MMADDYAALLDAMKIDSADVIGWSDGGINALLLAIRHPEKVKRLASTGANLVPDTHGCSAGNFGYGKSHVQFFEDKDEQNK